MEATLSVEVENARIRITEIQVELESAIEQLGEAKVMCEVQWQQQIAFCYASINNVIPNKYSSVVIYSKMI